MASSLDHGFSSPPGTFQLIRDDKQEGSGQRVLMLDPVASTDPNEPLNWSLKRKAINFSLVLAVTCTIFTALTMQAIFWQLMVVDFHANYEQLQRAQSVNFVGLATGCIFFIPYARKYGRRPIYLVSTALMLVASFWFSEMKSVTELYIVNLLQGLAGATNETIVQVTVADLFFVHQRGRANGLYMSMVMCGSFLTPLTAGTQAQKQGWRWCYRTLGIVNVILFVLFLVFYEETKFRQTIHGIFTPDEPLDGVQRTGPNNLKQDQAFDVTSSEREIRPSGSHREIDHRTPIHTRRQRLAFIMPTNEPILPYFYRPFVVLFTFPAVLFSGLQYASGVVWLTVMATVLALVFPGPPYHFNPAQVAYMNIGPFIGNLIGAFYGGYLVDRAILYYSWKKKGLFEPEMRLYILHLLALCMCGGMVMFGATVAKGMHWILPCVAGGLFGFGLGNIGDASLTFVIDSYTDVTGDAFTAIAFVRNAISIGIPFAIVPWMRGGLSNMFICAGFVSLAISTLCIPMILYGKKIRQRTSPCVPSYESATELLK